MPGSDSTGAHPIARALRLHARTLDAESRLIRTLATFDAPF
ncbi:hypothetical protein ACWEQ8_35025 [Streptomyces noursei]